MENKELKNPMLNELEEDMLRDVSGGTLEGTSEDIYATCPYCCGRLYLTINNVPVEGEIKCSYCGYVDGDPSTIPDLGDIK